jgi:hypothetical protein
MSMAAKTSPGKRWQKPAALRPGDAVAVIAPSGPVPSERLEAGLAVLSERYRVVQADGLLDAAGVSGGGGWSTLGRAALGTVGPAASGGVLCARRAWAAAASVPAADGASPGAAAAVAGRLFGCDGAAWAAGAPRAGDDSRAGAHAAGRAGGRPIASRCGRCSSLGSHRHRCSVYSRWRGVRRR